MQGAVEALDYGILPWAAIGSTPNTHAEPWQGMSGNGSENAVPIHQHGASPCFVKGECLADLLGYPCAGGVMGRP